jgi:hypothetical protein
MFRLGYPAGSRFVVLTENAPEGFCLNGEAAGFELAGADGVFYLASAAFAPDCITLTAKEVPAPVFARYAWTNYMKVTVFGMNGLPLAPFRTDHVPLAAENPAPAHV